MLRYTILGTLTTALALTSTAAFAETGKTASSTRPIIKLENKLNASTSRPLLRDRANGTSTKMVDSVCAKTAVDTRKASLVSIYAKFTGTLNTSLSTREDSIKTSFDQTSKKTRQEARTAARGTYKKEVKAAFETLRTNEKSTMKTYSTSIKACGGTNVEASDEASDGSIADSIK